MSPIRGGRIAVVVIFATILIDFIGYSILLPVLPQRLQGMGASGTQVGLIMSLYIIGLVLFLPLWGWISDRIGRRPVILVCLVGTAVSFIALSMATTIWEFIIARALGGFFGASVGTAQAYMTDITNQDDRAGGLGVIGAAGGAGLVFGPALGGILSRLDPLAPFYAPAILALVSLVLAAIALPESRASEPREVGLGGAVRTLIPTPVLVLVAAHDNRTRLYLYLFFHIFAAFAALEAMFPLYAERLLNWDEFATGLFLGYIGVVMAITQGVLVGRLARLVGEVPLVMVGLLLTGLCMVGLGGSPSVGRVVLLGFGIAVGNGLMLPVFTSLFSKNCGEEHESGEYMAHSQSMLQTGRGVGFLWGGWALENIGVGAPFWLGGLGMLVGLGIFMAGLRYLVRPSRH